VEGETIDTHVYFYYKTTVLYSFKGFYAS